MCLDGEIWGWYHVIRISRSCQQLETWLASQPHHGTLLPPCGSAACPHYPLNVFSDWSCENEQFKNSIFPVTCQRVCVDLHLLREGKKFQKNKEYTIYKYYWNQFSTFYSPNNLLVDISQRSIVKRFVVADKASSTTEISVNKRDKWARLIAYLQAWRRYRLAYRTPQTYSFNRSLVRRAIRAARSLTFRFSDRIACTSCYFLFSSLLFYFILRISLSLSQSFLFFLSAPFFKIFSLFFFSSFFTQHTRTHARYTSVRACWHAIKPLSGNPSAAKTTLSALKPRGRQGWPG